MNVHELIAWVEEQPCVMGWFWDKGHKQAKYDRLKLIDLHCSGQRYRGGSSNWYDHFALVNPFAPKLISTQEEAIAWAKKNPERLVLVDGVIEYAKDWGFNHSQGLQKYQVQVSLTEWKPITEIEVGND